MLQKGRGCNQGTHNKTGLCNLVWNNAEQAQIASVMVQQPAGRAHLYRHSSGPCHTNEVGRVAPAAQRRPVLHGTCTGRRARMRPGIEAAGQGPARTPKHSSTELSGTQTAASIRAPPDAA